MFSNQMAPTPLLIFFLVGPFFTQTTDSFTQSLPMKPLRQKLTQLHFYFHGVVAGPNASAIRIIQLAQPTLSYFGTVSMMDDLLTEGPEADSKPMGRAQGFYAAAAQDELGFLMAMNLVFTEGKYNGSVLSVLGRNPVLHPVREMPVLGGSGLFRFARGYALAHTYFLDFKTGDTVVEYNVTVNHY